jgi:hypothetical protein
MEQDIQDMYADISAFLLALTNALSAKGVITKPELAEAFQGRLRALQPDGLKSAATPHPLLLLKQMAVALNASPPR